MSGNFWLTEEQFNKIRSLLPNKLRGVPRMDDRRVLSGIIFCLQRGYRWSDVPDEYDPAKTLYNRYKRCSEVDVSSVFSPPSPAKAKRSFNNLKLCQKSLV